MIQLKPQTENEKKRFEQGDKLNTVTTMCSGGLINLYLATKDECSN